VIKSIYKGGLYQFFILHSLSTIREGRWQVFGGVKDIFYPTFPKFSLPENRLCN